MKKEALNLKKNKDGYEEGFWKEKSEGRNDLIIWIISKIEEERHKVTCN